MLSVIYSGRPGRVSFTPTAAFVSCFLRSVSISTVRRPELASDRARFAEMVVLPSPGSVLVTRITCAPGSVIVRSSFMRRPRMASTKSGSTPAWVSEIMPFPLRRFFAEVRATLASIGTFADALRSAALNIVLRIMASTSAARQLWPRPSMPPLTAEPFHEKLLYGAVGTVGSLFMMTCE